MVRLNPKRCSGACLKRRTRKQAFENKRLYNASPLITRKKRMKIFV